MKYTRYLFLVILLLFPMSYCGPLANNSLELGGDFLFRTNLYGPGINSYDYTFSPYLNYYFTQYFFIGAAYEIGVMSFENITTTSWDCHIGFTLPVIFRLSPFFYAGFGYWNYIPPATGGWSLIPAALGFKFNVWNNFLVSPNYKFYVCYSLAEAERGFFYRHAFSISLSYLITFGKKKPVS
jgi:hypothetical protein